MKKALNLITLAALFSIHFLLGCSGEASNKDGQKNVSDPGERVIGKWTVNDEATRHGWGDKSAEMEKKMVDEMGMSLEFKEGNVVTGTKRSKSGDGYWEILTTSADSLKIIVASNKNAEKKVEVKITFQGDDQFLYQSSEMEFAEDLIFQRVDN